VVGLHVHRGHEIATRAEAGSLVDQVLAFADVLESRLGLSLETIDLGGSLACPTVSAFSPLRFRLNSAAGVDLAPRELLKTLLGVERHEFHLADVVEDGGGDGAADIDVKAGPFALRVGQTEAGERAVGAAMQDAAILHRLECLCGRRLRGEDQGKSEDADYSFHLTTSSTRKLCGDPCD